MVPAAAMGLDVAKLLAGAERMLRACAPDVAAQNNPGLVLGTILGVAASKGIDKLTIVASPGLHDLGAWLEQLVAESTGKEGKGIIPVDRERVAAPPAYGDDRVFAYMRLEDAPDPTQDAAVAALEQAGQSGRHHPRPDEHTTWRPSSSAGRLRRRLRARSSASTRSTSLTSKPARSPRAR